jgi:outer membrane protein OmpA-like peptidoglycan-associated protein
LSRRTNPWPALVDLFSALLVATFAGFILLSSEYHGEVAGYRSRLATYESKEQALTKVRHEADQIVARLKEQLAKEEIKSILRPCGDDACLDLYIHFALNEDKITNADEARALETTCRTLRAALDSFTSEQKKDIELVIEGHADRSQAPGIIDPRAFYLFNWNLSAKRASSVLYEFQKCGLNPAEYSIVTIGYADSQPICPAPTLYCDDQNRRTTLRLRADTKRIEERLKAVQHGRGP